MPRLKITYEKEIVTKLMSKLSLKNKHEVPKIEKIILNMGLGEDASDGKKLKACLEDMALISGQKPVITKFKKSISNFKTRKDSNAGLKATLRKDKMYQFIDRLFNIHYKTSGAKEIIFICPLLLNSLVTGPKILVPTGSPLSSVNTTAFLSN